MAVFAHLILIRVTAPRLKGLPAGNGVAGILQMILKYFQVTGSQTRQLSVTSSRHTLKQKEYTIFDTSSKIRIGKKQAICKDIFIRFAGGIGAAARGDILLFYIDIPV